jgi:hypothetical protein
VTPIEIERNEVEEPEEDATETIERTAAQRTAEPDDADDQRALLFQRTVDLLSAHKQAIGEIVEVTL